MVEWQLIIIERFKKFLSTGTIDELQLLAFEKNLLAGLKSPQIIDFVKKKIGNLKSNLESGKLNIGKCKKQLNIKNKNEKTGKNRNGNNTNKKESNKTTNKNNTLKSVQNQAKTKKPKIVSQSHDLTSDKAIGQSHNMFTNKIEKTGINRNRNDSNKKNSIKTINKSKTLKSVRKPIKTEKLIFIGQSHNLTSEKVIGQSINMVAACVGITELMLTVFLQSKGFIIELNQKFTNEMWNNSAKFLIDLYDEKEKSKKHLNELRHDPHKCTKLNYGKLIYIGRSSK